MRKQKTCYFCKDKGWLKNKRTKRYHACDICNEVEYHAEFFMDLTGATKDQAVEAAAWGIAQAFGVLHDQYRKFK